MITALIINCWAPNYTDNGCLVGWLHGQMVWVGLMVLCVRDMNIWFSDGWVD